MPRNADRVYARGGSVFFDPFVNGGHPGRVSFPLFAIISGTVWAVFSFSLTFSCTGGYIEILKIEKRLSE